MENLASTLLNISFELREPWSSAESRAQSCLKALVEIPEWAPPQSTPLIDRFAPSEVDHYESWQGISW